MPNGENWTFMEKKSFINKIKREYWEFNSLPIAAFCTPIKGFRCWKINFPSLLRSIKNPREKKKRKGRKREKEKEKKIIRKSS